MSWVLVAYWVCFGVGTVYALVSALMTGFFGFVGGGGGEDIGSFEVGHDFGVEGGDAGGHGEAFAVAAEGEPVIAPLSPATISVFLATFGGVGIILTTLFDFSLYLSLPISAGAGLVVAGVVFALFYRLFTAVQGSSEPRMAEATGVTAEVTVPISKEGVGEVAFVVRGARLVSPARSQEGVELPRHTAVRIVRRVGTTLYVTALTEEESGEQAPETGSAEFRD
jgi:membrane protein implicated in regulation of membrane protease activity